MDNLSDPRRLSVAGKMHRPWGWYEVLASGPGWLVKRLAVKSGHCTSLQYHRNRSETWVVVWCGGGPEGADVSAVEVDGSFATFGARLWNGAVIEVQKGSVHRIYGPIVIIETQYGEPDELDIVRLRDDYGRTT